MNCRDESRLKGNAKMRVFDRKHLVKRGSVPFSQLMRLDNVRVEAFVNRQRKSSEGIGNDGVPEVKEGVQAAGPRRD